MFQIQNRFVAEFVSRRDKKINKKMTFFEYTLVIAIGV